MGLQAASAEMEMREVEGIYHMKLGQREISSPGSVKAIGRIVGQTHTGTALATPGTQGLSSGTWQLF